MSFLAVIPGLAPGLVAILPQLLLLAVVALTLLASPRAWWRGLRLCARHPLRASGTALVLALLVLGVRELLALVPEARPGSGIPTRVAGFAIGDARASRDRSSGPGPVALPTARPLDLGVAVVPGELSGFEEYALLLHGDRRMLSCLYPPGPRLLWTRELGAEVVVGPIAFERVEGSKAALPEERWVLVITAPGGDAGPGALVVLDGDDGTTRSRRDLPGRPQPAGARIDDRVVLALDGAIACFTLSGPGAPRALWTWKRAPGEAVGLVGDESGRYFVLDSSSLASGDLEGPGPEGGALRILARFDGETPVSLAARSGLVYVLTERQNQEAILRCFDPALEPAAPTAGAGDVPDALRWSVPTPRPLAGEFLAAPCGIVLTFRDGLEIRDRMTGRLRRPRLRLDVPCVAPAAGGRFGCFALLSDRTVLRYSEALDRVQWRVACTGSAGREAAALEADSVPAVLAIGERLLVRLPDAFYEIAEPEGSGSTAWSHWRGGPSRCGTLDGSGLPLSASSKWRWNLAHPADFRGPLQATVLPLADGWLAVEALSGATRLTRLDDAGEARSAVELTGRPRGVVHDGERVLLACQDRLSGARVHALTLGELPEDGTPPVSLWSVPVPPLGAPLQSGDSTLGGELQALAASRELVIVASSAGLRALSVFDGSRRWESGAIRGAASPLVDRDRVYAGEGPGEIRGTEAARSFAALELRTGELLWQRREDGWDWGPASVLDDALLVPVAVADRGRRVLCLDASNGKTRWEYAVAGDPPLAPVAVADEQVVFRLQSGATVVLSAGGEEQGRVEAGAPPSRSFPPPPPVVGLGSLVLADGKTVRCVDSLTLDPVWELELPARVHELTLDGDEILAATSGALFCLGAAR